MDVCILYFSGTGNTWWVSKKLTEELINKGRTAEYHSIELLDIQEASALINDSDMIIFAYPIYGSCVPEPMKKFIDNLQKPIKPKRTGIFCTQMAFSGDGAWHYHKILEQKGFAVVWTHHFKMPNNISIKASPIAFSDDLSKIGKIMKKCGINIKKAADEIALGKSRFKGKGLVSFLLGLSQRPIFKHLTKRPFKSPYKTNPQKCVKCMRCIQICPEGNIKLSEEGIIFGTDCALCLRCYSFCPKTAIKAYGLSHSDKKKTYRGPDGYDPALIAARKDLMDYMEF